MKMTIAAVAISAVFATGAAHADGFNNGGFETGTLAGWSVDGGTISSVTQPSDASALLTPGNYSGSATTVTVNGVTATHDSAFAAVTVTSAGTDAITGLSTVRYGDHSVRVNDANNNYSVSLLQQKVTNYSSTTINFSWAAVLEASHGATDSDEFTIVVNDDTLGTTLTTIHYNSYLNGALFQTVGSWFYTQWQDESINVTAGHDYTLSLLAADCPYGGHAGYVYLDGFGDVVGGNGDPGTALPEPASVTLAMLALAGVAWSRRKSQAV